ncbi:MAG TPA: hypothetical protein VM347_24360 [Nonomuraea sp.]|nr:hypothetical protein [Nonomuraea sp.]
MALAVLIGEDRPAALRMAALLPTFWEDTGRVEMGRKLTDQALEGQHRAATLDRDVSAAIPRALLAAAELAFRDGDKGEALKQAHATVRAAVLIEDYETAARAKVMLSRSALREQADQRQTQAGRINPTET